MHTNLCILSDEWSTWYVSTTVARFGGTKKEGEHTDITRQPALKGMSVTVVPVYFLSKICYLEITNLRWTTPGI